MTKEEIKKKILEISERIDDPNKILDEVFKIGLDYDILENYSGYDPMDTVIGVVVKILGE